MVEQNTREQITKAIRSYMSKETTSDEFDETTYGIRAATKDETAAFVIGKIQAYYYDDMEAHKIVATKEELEFLERCIRLLDSDQEIEITVTPWRWGLRQAIAAACYTVFVAAALPASKSPHSTLLLGCCLLGCTMVSICLAWFRAKYIAEANSNWETRLKSFGLVDILLNNYSEKNNVKVISSLVSRADLVLSGRARQSWITALPLFLIWCLFSPVVLLLQVLPERDKQSKTRITY